MAGTGVTLTIGTTSGHQVAAPLERWIVAILTVLDERQLARALALADGQGVEPLSGLSLPPMILTPSS